jgi:hypothetical protein
MKVIKYKNGLKYVGPAKYQPKWQRGKGVGKKQIAQYLKQHQEQYPQYYVMATENKCVHKVKILVRGKWGPHNAKKQCAECGKWIKWVSVCK